MTRLIVAVVLWYSHDKTDCDCCLIIDYSHDQISSETYLTDGQA